MFVYVMPAFLGCIIDNNSLGGGGKVGVVGGRGCSSDFRVFPSPRRVFILLVITNDLDEQSF